MKDPPDGLFTHLFFASEIILIFGGLFIYILSEIIKVKIIWLRVTTNDLAKQKIWSRSENLNSSNLSWKGIYNGVSTIGGNDIIPKGVGTVSLSWNYDYIHAHKGIEYCILLYRLANQYTKYNCTDWIHEGWQGNMNTNKNKTLNY